MEDKESWHKVSLPRNIKSTHTICHTEVECEEENPNLDYFNEELKKAKELYDNEEYEKARLLLENISSSSIAGKYYLALIYYDGLGGIENQSLAFNFMKSISCDPMAGHLAYCALYNMGRAYYEGFGVKQSDDEAEKCWLLSARDGSAKGCVKAQSVLGMFYARRGEDNFNLKKSHYWHQEATGNGSLESQGTLGVMYEYGIGVEKNIESSFKCFKSAAERGNVYAMGSLAFHYYKIKLFNNACELARRVGSLEKPDLLSRQTDCVESHIRKGISLGCWIYGRCIERGIVEDQKSDEALKWYSRAALFDPDTAQNMQDLVTYGKI